MLVDTIKMICYRSETLLITVIQEHISRKDEARTLIRQIFKTEIGLRFDKEKNILNVCLNNLTAYSEDKAVIKLIEVLNSTETIFPGTDLKSRYSLLHEKHACLYKFMKIENLGLY